MDDNLARKEEELFDLIIGWVKNGYPGRASLLNHVRYQNMNEDFKKNIIDSMEDDSLKNAIRRSLTNERIIGMNPRNPNEIVLAIGGMMNYPDGPFQPIEIGASFGLPTQTWKAMKAEHKMPVKRAFHGIGLVNNIIYLFGGLFQVPGNIENTDLENSSSTVAFDTIKKVSK